VSITVEQRALDAACTVATAHGVACEQAAIIHRGSNVLVHLRPAPVVARVMSGTVVLHADPQTWLEREISVLEFLAPSGVAVAPSPLITAGPHQHDGLWMTFSERIADLAQACLPVDAARLGRSLRTLHDELASFHGELGQMNDLRDDTARLHRLLRPAEDLDIDAISSLRTRLDLAWDRVAESNLPVQALHGDVSLRNLLRTPDRLVWNDFEDTFRGPLHWDVASYVMSLRAQGATSAFVRRVLDNYGWDGEDELAPFVAAHDARDEIWRHYDRQRRRAQLGDALLAP
jgi:hypothetical protein